MGQLLASIEDSAVVLVDGVIASTMPEIVLLATVVPTHIGGWGPREGVCHDHRVRRPDARGHRARRSPARRHPAETSPQRR